MRNAWFKLKCTISEKLISLTSLGPCGLGNLTYRISIECTERDETGLTAPKISVRKGPTKILLRVFCVGTKFLVNTIREPANFLIIFIIETFMYS